MWKLASVMMLSLVMLQPVQGQEQALSWEQVLSQAQITPEELGLSGEPTAPPMSTMSWEPFPPWEEGEQYETTLSMVGISIADGKTVFFMQAAISFADIPPFNWTPDPEDDCSTARAFRQLFFSDDSENPSFAKQSMYLMALNALSRRGRVTLEAGACEMLPAPEHVPPFVTFFGGPSPHAIKIERVILSD